MDTSFLTNGIAEGGIDKGGIKKVKIPQQHKAQSHDDVGDSESERKK